MLEWWNEGCPVSARHARAGTMVQTFTKYQDKGVVWLAINSTSSATNGSDKKAAEAAKLNYPILNDASGDIGHAYGARTTPHMFMVNKSGKLVYDGAIDDDPGGSKSDKLNYVAKALDELLAGKSVSTPETKPYGCGVKYK